MRGAVAAAIRVEHEGLGKRVGRARREARRARPAGVDLERTRRLELLVEQPDLIDSAVANGAKGLVIAGVGNGNPLSLEPFQADHRRLFYGKAMLILRTTETPGTIKVAAQAEGLQPASVTLSSR